MTALGVMSQKRSDRMVRLLAILDEQGHVTLGELASSLGVSEATVRRDVGFLADKELLQRTHGGARPIQGNRELPVGLRNSRHAEEKASIAAAAVTLLPAEPHTVAFTGGTTTAAALHALGTRSDLTIVTNSLAIGMLAAEQGHGRILIAGGVLRRHTLELVGKLTEATLRLVNIGTAFVGVDGVSVEGGLTTHDETEARANRIMIERAAKVVALADGSKIGRITVASMAPLAKVSVLVTDSAADPAELAKIRAAGVHVHLVD